MSEIASDGGNIAGHSFGEKGAWDLDDVGLKDVANLEPEVEFVEFAGLGGGVETAFIVEEGAAGY